MGDSGPLAAALNLPRNRCGQGQGCTIVWPATELPLAATRRGVDLMMDDMTGMGSGMLVWGTVGVLLVVLLALVIVKLLQK